MDLSSLHVLCKNRLKRLSVALMSRRYLLYAMLQAYADPL